MAESADDARRARGMERFLMFSDGVAAIAVTLLVLPLVDAVTDSNREGLKVWDIIRSMDWEIFSFVLSFVVIVVLWQVHQGVFQDIRTYDPVIMRAGIVWLFAIVSLSFSTALISAHSGEQLTVIIYIVNLAVAIGSMTLATTHLHRHHELLHPDVVLDHDELLDSWINLGLVVVALLLVLIVPRLGFFVLLLLMLDTPILRLLKQRGMFQET